jgi:GT2 family glycosyltransferase
MSEISVIIVNWNGRHLLEDCLGSLRRQTFKDFETIFVDNGSSDDSVDYVREFFPEVTIVALQENHGFTGGNIAGYEVSTGQLIALLNNDTEADPGWLEQIHKGMLDYPKAGSFASKMMYFDERTRIENCGFDGDPSGTTIDLGRDQPDGIEWTFPRPVFGACGGAAVYRRSMLQHIGFLDPDFFMLYEDVDLAFRAQLCGYGCVYLPNAVVYHRYRSSIKKRPESYVFYGQRNIDFVYIKNLPLSLMLRSALRRLIFELGAAAYFLWHGSGTTFVRAKLDVLRMLPAMLKKRRSVQAMRVLQGTQYRAILRGPTLAAKWRKVLAAASARRDLNPALRKEYRQQSSG